MEAGERDSLLRKNSSAVLCRKTNDVDTEKLAQVELRGHRLFLILSTPLLGLFLVALDVTLTSVISASVASDFASLSLVSWLGSAYLVAMTIVQSLSGSLTDKFGRRSGFLLGIVLFGAGNLLCGLAPTVGTLIAARAVAGAGGGAINSITTFVISDLVPIRKRPMWQGLGNVAWAFGMGMGGIFGGVINDLAGWRWAFIALMPFIIAVAGGSYLTFVRGLPYHDQSKNDKSAAIDYLGSITLAGMLICLILGLNLAENGIPKDTESRLQIFGLLMTAAAFLAALAAVEKWLAPNPVIPLHFLANRSVASSCLSGLFIASSMHTLLYYVPIFVQAQGFTTSQVGIQLLGEPIGAAIAPFLVGFAIRQLGSYTILKPVSWSIYVAAPLILYLSNIHTPSWIIVAALVALGGGFGSVLTVNLTGLLANIDHRYQAKSTAMAYVFRQSGASIGLAVAGVLFKGRVAKSLAYTHGTLSYEADNSIKGRCSMSRMQAGSYPSICLTYAAALHQVFAMALVAAVIATFFGMLIKSQPLDQEPEKTEQADDDDSQT